MAVSASLFFVTCVGTTVVYAAGPVKADFATAGDFAVLAGSTITNTGSSVVNGNLGLSPGLSVTGFPPGTLNGVEYIGAGAGAQALADSTQAYNDLAGRTSGATLATELGGTTRFAGVYDSVTGTFGITGTLTLDAQGDPDAVFIFKTSTTLITAAVSSISLIGGAQACNVFWQVGSSATLGSNSSMSGNIVALTSVTLTTGASVSGRVFAGNGAVTLDTNTITKPTTCTTQTTPTTVTGTSASHSTGSHSGSHSGGRSHPFTQDVVTTTITTTVFDPHTVDPTPFFPDTGFAPEGFIVSWPLFIFACITLFVLGIFLKKDSLSFILSSFCIISVAVFYTPVVVSKTERSSTETTYHLTIPSIHVSAPVGRVGLTSFGAMDVSESPLDVSLFEGKTHLGGKGSVVIAGHYGWFAGKAAAFDNLSALEKGDKLFVDDGKGGVSIFVVKDIRVYDALAIAPEVFGSKDGSHLNLISCTGPWDASKNAYPERLVVFSDLI